MCVSRNCFKTLYGTLDVESIENRWHCNLKITISFTEVILVCYRKGTQYFGVMKVHFVLLIVRWFGHFGTLAASGKFIKQLTYFFWLF